MIGLSILLAIIIYVSLAVMIVRYVKKKTESKIKRYGTMALVILLPFWDMILHYPVYWLLSSTVPEIERYQPYKKIEGFYEDFIPQGNIAYNMFLHKAFENQYTLYFEKTGEYNKQKGEREKLYYKAYWLNNSDSPNCFSPKPSTVEEKYIEFLENNWCIAVESINENEMTNYWKLTKKKAFSFPIFYLNVQVVDFFVSDRTTGAHFFRLRDVYVDKSWMTAINVVTGNKTVRSGTKFTYASSGGKHFNFPDHKIIKLLDSKEIPEL